MLNKLYISGTINMVSTFWSKLYLYIESISMPCRPLLYFNSTLCFCCGWGVVPPPEVVPPFSGAGASLVHAAKANSNATAAPNNTFFFMLQCVFVLRPSNGTLIYNNKKRHEVMYSCPSFARYRQTP